MTHLRHQRTIFAVMHSGVRMQSLSAEGVFAKKISRAGEDSAAALALGCGQALVGQRRALLGEDHLTLTHLPHLSY